MPVSRNASRLSVMFDDDHAVAGAVFIDDAERKLDGRPRKSLDWRKPSEKMAELVALTS